MILDRILADKKVEVAERKSSAPQIELEKAVRDMPPTRDFFSALKSGLPDRQTPRLEIKLIAEVKKASPSKGLIRPDFDPISIAKIYQESGAAAISVLTDEKYFQGRLEYLTDVRNAVNIPALRKDFIVDAYQIYEARSANADSILLIVAALGPTELSEFKALAAELGMDSLVEVHTKEELDIALEIGAEIIGINNRNLQTFETTIETTQSVAKYIPGDRILISESGIFTREDVERLMKMGVDGILVGESLMREPDPGVKARELLGG